MPAEEVEALTTRLTDQKKPSEDDAPQTDTSVSDDEIKVGCVAVCLATGVGWCVVLATMRALWWGWVGIGTGVEHRRGCWCWC